MHADICAAHLVATVCFAVTLRSMAGLCWRALCNSPAERGPVHAAVVSVLLLNSVSEMSMLPWCMYVYTNWQVHHKSLSC